MEGSAQALLTGLDPEQAAAVTSPARTVAVLAGAGSGKTRVLTRRVAFRIADGTAEAHHSLVLTFTRKAADELRERSGRWDAGAAVTTGTFHSVAFAQLRRRWLEQGRAVPTIVAHPLRLVEHVLQTIRMGRSVNARALATEIAWAKSRGLDPQDYEEQVLQLMHRPPVAAHQVARVYEAYESEKRKRRVVDYDDLLLLACQAMSTDKAFAAAQRWLFRHVYVDEFQDLNKAQFDLLQCWLGESPDLFVVGDGNQAIYGWNGADARYLNDIARHFPGVELFKLERNYRSTGEVLAAAGSVLPATKHHRQATVHDLDRPENGPVPRIITYRDEHEEAKGIARSVREAHGRGLRWRDIAVLVRTNMQRGPIEAAMSEIGVPFQSTGGLNWLKEPDVASVLDMLRESPRRPLAQRVGDIEEHLRDVPLVERRRLEELLSSARQCLAGDPEMLIADFLSWIEVASRHDGPLGEGTRSSLPDGSVTITTFHRAKGLEWSFVTLAGLEDGLVPLSGTSGAQLEEERRLFYVAVTRSRSELLCTWAQQRTNARRQTVARTPSPWLLAIERSTQEIEPPSVALARGEIARVRDALQLDDVGDLATGASTQQSDEGVALLPEGSIGRPAPSRLGCSDDELRSAFVRWRSSRARMSGIEPKLIVSDGLIDVIVKSRPSSIEELSSMAELGPVRAVSLGAEILGLVESHSVSGIEVDLSGTTSSVDLKETT